MESNDSSLGRKKKGFLEAESWRFRPSEARECSEREKSATKSGKRSRSCFRGEKGSSTKANSISRTWRSTEIIGCHISSFSGLGTSVKNNQRRPPRPCPGGEKKLSEKTKEAGKKKRPSNCFDSRHLPSAVQTLLARKSCPREHT